jgi:hypothetical protein
MIGVYMAIVLTSYLLFIKDWDDNIEGKIIRIISLCVLSISLIMILSSR